jgi:hypothetical protein
MFMILALNEVLFLLIDHGQSVIVVIHYFRYACWTILPIVLGFNELPNRDISRDKIRD